jgi:hypothetical protein
VADFQGLRYYRPDPAWRLPGEFHRYGRIRRLRLPDSSGATIVVERYGRFVFEHDGKPFWLEVYRSLQGGGLTVYFTDATNGDLTYGAGRYASVNVSEEGSYVLDFNGSYNPPTGAQPLALRRNGRRVGRWSRSCSLILILVGAARMFMVNSALLTQTQEIIWHA